MSDEWWNDLLHTCYVCIEYLIFFINLFWWWLVWCFLARRRESLGSGGSWWSCSFVKHNNNIHQSSHTKKSIVDNRSTNQQPSSSSIYYICTYELITYIYTRKFKNVSLSKSKSPSKEEKETAIIFIVFQNKWWVRPDVLERRVSGIRRRFSCRETSRGTNERSWSRCRAWTSPRFTWQWNWWDSAVVGRCWFFILQFSTGSSIRGKNVFIFNFLSRLSDRFAITELVWTQFGWFHWQRSSADY